MRKWFYKLIVWAVFFCLLWVTPVLADVAQYTYDNLNRLIQVQYEDGTSIQYTYDAAGNRLTKQVTVPPPPPGAG
jgi:YD repeat-containing protein